MGLWLVSRIWRFAAAFAMCILLSIFMVVLIRELRVDRPLPCGCGSTQNASYQKPADVRVDLLTAVCRNGCFLIAILTTIYLEARQWPQEIVNDRASGINGFTLIELLVVVGIVALLIGLLLDRCSARTRLCKACGLRCKSRAMLSRLRSLRCRQSRLRASRTSAGRSRAAAVDCPRRQIAWTAFALYMV